jgi:hypothetical protein
MKASQRVYEASRARIRSWRARQSRCARRLPRSVPRLRLGVRVRFSVVALLLHRHNCSKYQGFPHLLRPLVFNRPVKCGPLPCTTQKKMREGRVPLPIKQARCWPAYSRSKLFVLSGLVSRSWDSLGRMVTKSYVLSRGKLGLAGFCERSSSPTEARA